MQAPATQTASDDVRSFVQEYFDAWKGTDEQKILDYYAEDVILDLPSGTLREKLRFETISCVRLSPVFLGMCIPLET